MIEADQFTLMGRVHTDPLPSITETERVTYARNVDGTSAQVDVFAASLTGINQPVPMLQVLGANIPGAFLTQNPASSTHFYGQVIPFNPQQIPASVLVTNTTDVPPTTVEANVTDLVTVKTAVYTPGAPGVSATLKIEADSSDKLPQPTLTDPVGLPKLIAQGSNGAALGTLDVNGALTVDLTVPPPQSVTVLSSAGGKASLAVSTGAGPAGNGPQAVNDVGVDPTQPIGVLANDLNLGANPTVRIVRAPEHGTATVTGPTVAYTVQGTFSGPDSFTYVVNAANGVSNIATVTFDVVAVNRAPVAVNDTANVTRGASVTINVLANDSDPDGDPLTVTAAVNTSATPVGTVTSLNNQVVYAAPAAGGTSPQTISYTISDGNLTATATVTVTLLTAEVINFTKAQYVQSKRQWGIEGTNTPAPPAGTTVTMTIHAGPTIAGPVIGVATQLAGSTTWKFTSAINSPVNPDVTRTVSVESSRGGVRLAFPHTVN